MTKLTYRNTTGKTFPSRLIRRSEKVWQKVCVEDLTAEPLETLTRKLEVVVSATSTALEFPPSVQFPAFPPAVVLEGVEPPVAESPAVEVRTGSFPFPTPPCFTTIQLPKPAVVSTCYEKSTNQLYLKTHCTTSWKLTTRQSLFTHWIPAGSFAVITSVPALAGS